MRVKISYTVDLEEVPKKIQELLDESLKKLNKSMDLVRNASLNLDSSDLNVNQAMNGLERARLVLADVDQILLDSGSITSGLNDYYNGEKNVSEGRPIMDSSRNDATPT